MSVPRDRFYGYTPEQWLAQIPDELSVDAVGLWQLVSFGRDGFGLSGDDLVQFVRKALLALLGKGAKPVVGAQGGTHVWEPVDYGDSPDQVSDAIIAEWKRSNEDPDAGGVWFALPHIMASTRVP